jgi:hypothetical protein
MDALAYSHTRELRHGLVPSHLIKVDEDSTYYQAAVLGGQLAQAAITMAIPGPDAPPAGIVPRAAGGVNGSWVRAAESMSERAAAYQARFGRVGEVFHVNGVKFDGVVNGVLQEAKGPGYATFVRNGSFQPWFRGADALVDQARRQVAAAGGAPIQWHFAEEAAANATRSLFTERGVTGIQVLFTP